MNKCRWIYKEINKFSKSINNSQKAFHSPTESINLSADQQNIIPIPTHLIFPTPTSCNFTPPYSKQNQRTPFTLTSKDCTAQLALQNPNIFPINVSTLIPHKKTKNHLSHQLLCQNFWLWTVALPKLIVD